MELTDVFKHVTYKQINKNTYSIEIENMLKGMQINDALYFDKIYESKDIYLEEYRRELLSLQNRCKDLNNHKKALIKCYTSITWYLIYLYSQNIFFTGIFHWHDTHEKIYQEIEDIIIEKSSIESELEIFPRYIEHFYQCQKEIVDLLQELKFDIEFIDMHKSIFDIIREI
jgi:hypothetical protein